MGSLPAVKNQAYTLRVPVVDQASRPAFKNTPTYAAGDLKLKIDGGAEANPTSVTVDGYYLVVALTAAEMNGDLILLRGKDAAGAEWDDFVYEIRTTDPTYQAKVQVIDDNTNNRDMYIVTWYRDGALITSGITLPEIYVFDEDNTDWIGTSAAEEAMNEIGTKQAFIYEATGADRITSGVAYIARVSATIDGSIRTWYQPIFRDS